MHMPLIMTFAAMASTALAADSTGSRPVLFSCDNGITLSVLFAKDHADVTLADGTVVSLPQQIAASGYWYSNGRYELRGKGDEAKFAIGRMAPSTCKAN
ncbi:MliC family protein [Peteryoungia desertarenae]|uniref:MliC family protein n=1 Tax=Peteryoungia desertarenae TaxID=1813451 RepID=A0ABX6QPL8_9HYPH|nr:MliC family protein [Peteryoungia desertarenae]QLF70187.1 MliC family protein [Peteryoungia desertarenae]